MYSPYYSPLENSIRKSLLVHNIRTPDQLTIENISRKLKLQIRKDPDFSAHYGNCIIIQEGTPQEEWQHFVHELCHYLRHCGNQLHMHYLFRQLQEYQAKHFAYHFCVPSFMLERIRLPPDRNGAIRTICTTFNVEPEFAARRLEMHEAKHLNRIMNL